MIILLFFFCLDWFPRTKKDLDILSHKVFEGGKELKADHPVSAMIKKFVMTATV